MLDKTALEIIEDLTLGFCSCLFLVEKASSALRLVIDLSLLNEFIQQTLFRMEMASFVLKSIRKNGFMASVNLKDVYFQVPIHRACWKYLQFVCQKTVLSISRSSVSVSLQSPWSSPEFLRWYQHGLTVVDSSFSDILMIS